MPHEACNTLKTQANQTKERLSIAEYKMQKHALCLACIEYR